MTPRQTQIKCQQEISGAKPLLGVGHYCLPPSLGLTQPWDATSDAGVCPPSSPYVSPLLLDSVCLNLASLGETEAQRGRGDCMAGISSFPDPDISARPISEDFLAPEEMEAGRESQGLPVAKRTSVS